VARKAADVLIMIRSVKELNMAIPEADGSAKNIEAGPTRKADAAIPTFPNIDITEAEE